MFYNFLPFETYSEYVAAFSLSTLGCVLKPEVLEGAFQNRYLVIWTFFILEDERSLSTNLRYL